MSASDRPMAHAEVTQRAALVREVFDDLFADHTAHAPPGALRRFLDGLPARDIVVPVNRATERRLRRAIRSFNDETPDDPMDPTDDEDLGCALLAAADRGLDAGETDDGVWAQTDGWCHRLPRDRRSPIRLRARFAWQAARRTWRAS